MKTFLTGLCLLLALMGGSSSVLAKDSTTKTGTVNKADFKNTVVNLNKADANTFSYYLKGVGPAKAQAIVDYRKSNGNFSNLDDLLKVPGIGEATFKGLKSNVSLSRGETTAPKTAASSTSKKTTSSSTKSDSSTNSSSSSKKAKESESSKTTTSKTSDDKKSSDKSTSSKTKSSKDASKDDKSKKSTTKSSSTKSDSKTKTSKSSTKKSDSKSKSSSSSSKKSDSKAKKKSKVKCDTAKAKASKECKSKK